MPDPHDEMTSYNRFVPSWQSRLASACVRACIRRRTWGDEAALTRRARRVFGAPGWYADLLSAGVARVPVIEPVRGEWLVPQQAAQGLILTSTVAATCRARR